MQSIEEKIQIPVHALSSATLRGRPVYLKETTLRAGDPALGAITDFYRESPICVAPSRAVQDALADMTRLNIHALLVVDPAPRDRRELLGLLSVHSVGPAARLHLRSTHPQAGGMLRVEEIMTPRDELALVHYDSLRSLRVRDLRSMFEGSGLTHVLVVEAAAEAAWAGPDTPAVEASSVARGIVSRADIERRLGAAVGEMRFS